MPGSTEPRQHFSIQGWVISILTAILIGFIGHTIGTERQMERVDGVEDRVQAVEKEIVELRALQRGISLDLDRSREESRQRWERLDSRLDAIYQEVRRQR